MREYTYDGVRIIVKRGDISAEDCEAIVNAANNKLWMASGVAGAIKQRGGDEIEKEAMELAPIRVGQAVITGGYKLPAKYVIHAAAMGEAPTDVPTAASSVMHIANENRIESIALCALGAGVAGVPIRRSIRDVLAAVKEAVIAGTTVREARMVVYSEEDLAVATEVADGLFKHGGSV